MSNITVIIVIVVAVVVIAAFVIAGYQMARRKRTERLRDQYGPEYDRAIDQAENQRAAESEPADAPSGTRSWSCAPSMPLSARTSNGGGPTYRASSWMTQHRRTQCRSPRGGRYVRAR